MNSRLNKVAVKESELKKILTEIKAGETNWNDENKLLIVHSMIEHIGSTDGELRDQLIYTSFFRLIIEENELEPELLKELLHTCLNDLLFKEIGENGTDTVFTRAFTTLLVALILYRDNEDDFLSQSTVYLIKDKLIQYINLEKDVRGYVGDKGWAHSIAHVADAFDELVKNNKISTDTYLEILEPLWNKVFISDSVYVHNEDERLVLPIIEMLEKGLEQQEIVNLLQRLPDDLKRKKDQLDNEKYWFLVFNSKTFLKSFYLEINKHSKLETLQKSIEQCLTKI
jgi:hypothetical protein